MNAFMMYMSGAGIHIFSIMITFMGIMNPVKAILNVHGGKSAASQPSSCLQGTKTYCNLRVLPLLLSVISRCVRVGVGW